VTLRRAGGPLLCPPTSRATAPARGSSS